MLTRPLWRDKISKTLALTSRTLQSFRGVNAGSCYKGEKDARRWYIAEPCKEEEHFNRHLNESNTFSSAGTVRML